MGFNAWNDSLKLQTSHYANVNCIIVYKSMIYTAHTHLCIYYNDITVSLMYRHLHSTTQLSSILKIMVYVYRNHTYVYICIVRQELISLYI